MSEGESDKLNISDFDDIDFEQAEIADLGGSSDAADEAAPQGYRQKIQRAAAGVSGPFLEGAKSSGRFGLRLAGGVGGGAVMVALCCGVGKNAWGPITYGLSGDWVGDGVDWASDTWQDRQQDKQEEADREAAETQQEADQRDWENRKEQERATLEAVCDDIQKQIKKASHRLSVNNVLSHDVNCDYAETPGDLSTGVLGYVKAEDPNTVHLTEEGAAWVLGTETNDQADGVRARNAAALLTGVDSANAEEGVFIRFSNDRAEPARIKYSKNTKIYVESADGSIQDAATDAARKVQKGL